MEFPGARNTAAGANAGVVNVETCTLTQSLELGDRQSEDGKMWTELAGSVVDNRAWTYENQMNVTIDGGEPTRFAESPQMTFVPPQQVVDVGDESDSCKALPEIRVIRTHRLVTDCYVPGVASAEIPIRVGISLPREVSPKDGGKNSDMRVGASVENCQQDINAGNWEEKVIEAASCSSKSTAELPIHSFTLKAFGDILQRASHDLEEGKQSEEYAVVAISYCLEKVSSKSTELKSSAVALFRDCETVEGSDDSRRFEKAREKIVSLDSRLTIVEDYIRATYAEAFMEGDGNVPVRELKTQQAGFSGLRTRRTPVASTIVNKTDSLTCVNVSRNRGENYSKPGDVRHTAYILQLLEFVADVRNIIVRQHRKQCKLCAVGELYVYRIEVSCRTLLHAVKSAVNVVRPALDATRLVQRALSRAGNLEAPRTGRSHPPAEHDVTLPDELTQSALTHAESVVRLHGEVVLALKGARKQLETLKLNESAGRDVLHHSNAFEKYVLDLLQQPSDIDFHELRERQTGVAFMREMLSLNLEEMVLCAAHIVNSSKTSSSAVEKVLHVLSSASESSCSAMETSLDALVKVLLSKRRSGTKK